MDLNRLKCDVAVEGAGFNEKRERRMADATQPLTVDSSGASPTISSHILSSSPTTACAYNLLAYAYCMLT